MKFIYNFYLFICVNFVFSLERNITVEQQCMALSTRQQGLCYGAKETLPEAADMILLWYLNSNPNFQYEYTHPVSCLDILTTIQYTQKLWMWGFITCEVVAYPASALQLPCLQESFTAVQSESPAAAEETALIRRVPVGNLSPQCSDEHLTVYKTSFLYDLKQNNQWKEKPSS